MTTPASSPALAVGVGLEAAGPAVAAAAELEVPAVEPRETLMFMVARAAPVAPAARVVKVAMVGVMACSSAR
ncbi:MAG: hypothetical protein LBR11_07400 [Deltaproteobacteria bacterium]|jgi:hypothetical protein|nr:hypothetical protein [Deltaproteobacteria bacterium]